MALCGWGRRCSRRRNSPSWHRAHRRSGRAWSPRPGRPPPIGHRRAGASTPFHFGDVLDASWANYNGGSIYGPSRKGVYRQRPVPVGFFGLVNRWGLAELHGQLFEWCGDQWHPDPTGVGWPSDGQPWQGVDPALEALESAQKEWRLLRGGSWFAGPHDCRAAFRYSVHPAYVSTSIGVRPCCPLPPGSLLGS
ncbi:MAG: formylglycine-generating enzyme family protein [Cyanobium sp.]